MYHPNWSTGNNDDNNYWCAAAAAANFNAAGAEAVSSLYRQNAAPNVAAVKFQSNSATYASPYDSGPLAVPSSSNAGLFYPSNYHVKFGTTNFDWLTSHHHSAAAAAAAVADTGAFGTHQGYACSATAAAGHLMVGHHHMNPGHVPSAVHTQPKSDTPMFPWMKYSGKQFCFKILLILNYVFVRAILRNYFKFRRLGLVFSNYVDKVSFISYRIARFPLRDQNRFR